MNSPITYSVYVKSITFEANNVLAYELRPVKDVKLPVFCAGAHIDLIIEGVTPRSYSLLNDPRETNRYVIAVAKDPKSRGGSRLIHEKLRTGDRLQVSAPKNYFPLTEGAHRTTLIAGGIGITPLWSMAQRLNALGAPWDLFYFARDRESAALLERIEQTSGTGHLHLNLALDVEATIERIQAIFAEDDGERHYYCCGPSGMLEAYKAAAAKIPSERVHYESFAPMQEANTAGGYDVSLARTGKTLMIQEGQTLLDALCEAGVEVMNSCREGICGACEVRVLAGIPDHRDSILSHAEREANKTMFVCCSGSKSPNLILDL